MTKFWLKAKKKSEKRASESVQIGRLGLFEQIFPICGSLRKIYKYLVNQGLLELFIMVIGLFGQKYK